MLGGSLMDQWASVGGFSNGSVDQFSNGSVDQCWGVI